MLKNSLSIIILIFILPLLVQAFEHHRWYVHVPIPMTWDEAQRYCRANHTDLAIIENQGEIGGLLNPCAKKRCWIGLHRDEEHPETWKWSNGENVHFESWHTGEPNNLNAKCGFTRYGLWHDTSCERQYESVCSEDDLILVEEEKTWEEALEHCRTLQTDPTSNNTHFNHLYDLPHMHAEKNNLFAKNLIQKAQTPEVWIGLRFLAGQWLWVDGFPLDEQQKNRLPVCPAPKMHCGTMSKTGGKFSERDCSERRNFFCL